MDALVNRLVEQRNVSPQTARALIVIVLQFLSREAPPETLAPVISAYPWIPDVLAKAEPEDEHGATSRHFGGMARLMDVANRMMAHGLTMAEVQATVRATVDYAREGAGDEAVNTLVRSIPGLRQVV
ncbi:hypothetical protein ACT6QH_13425 [Xanthobacter sp. TB0139]|uniref:hypothetical protein n=1 Tax=Xanthobacter sp. TB0139 TaxID=3459178 RepID=UPI0040392D74